MNRSNEEYQATMERSYAVIMGGGSESCEGVLTIDVAGNRALALFESAESAEEFRLLGGLGPKWGVIDDPDGVLPEFLREAVSPSVSYVAVNPPISLRGGEPPAVSLIPIERFLEG